LRFVPIAKRHTFHIIHDDICILLISTIIFLQQRANTESGRNDNYSWDEVQSQIRAAIRPEWQVFFLVIWNAIHPDPRKRPRTVGDLLKAFVTVQKQLDPARLALKMNGEPVIVLTVPPIEQPVVSSSPSFTRQLRELGWVYQLLLPIIRSIARLSGIILVMTIPSRIQERLSLPALNPRVRFLKDSSDASQRLASA